MSRIILPTADFSASLDYNLPVSDGAEYFNFFRGGSSSLARNLVKNKPGIAVYGTPAVNSGYVEFTGLSNYLETGVNDLDEFTLMSVAKTDSAALFKFLIATYQNSSSIYAGNALAINTYNDLTGFVTMDNAGAPSYLSTAISSEVESAWAFVIQRCTLTTNKIQDITKGTSQTASLTYAHQLNGLRYRIGSGHAGTNAGFNAQAFAGIYNRAIDDAELAAIYARVKATVALDSIII